MRLRIPGREVVGGVRIGAGRRVPRVSSAGRVNCA